MSRYYYRMVVYKGVEEWGPEGAHGRFTDLGFICEMKLIIDENNLVEKFHEKMKSFGFEDIQWLAFESGRLTGNRIENAAGDSDPESSWHCTISMWKSMC